MLRRIRLSKHVSNGSLRTSFAVPVAAVLTLLLLWATVALASRVSSEKRMPGFSGSSVLDYAPEARPVPHLRASFLGSELGTILAGVETEDRDTQGAAARGEHPPVAAASHSRSRNNDDFADAEQLDPPTDSDRRDLSDATLEDDEPQKCGAVSGTVWYRFATDRRMHVSLDDAGSNFVAVIAAYEGGELTSLRPMGCATGESAALGFTSEPGSVYHFQVGVSAGPGPQPSDKNLVIAFGVSAIPPPPPAPDNDNFSARTAIETVPYGDAANAASATLERSEPLPTCRRPYANVGATVWYRFTANKDQVLVVDASGYDTIVAVYRGNTLGSLSEVVCNGLSSAPTRSAAAFSATEGTTYSVQVGAEDGEGGRLDFRLCPGDQAFAGCGEETPPQP